MNRVEPSCFPESACIVTASSESENVSVPLLLIIAYHISGLCSEVCRLGHFKNYCVLFYCSFSYLLITNDAVISVAQKLQNSIRVTFSYTRFFSFFQS